MTYHLYITFSPLNRVYLLLLSNAFLAVFFHHCLGSPFSFHVESGPVHYLHIILIVNLLQLHCSLPFQPSLFVNEVVDSTQRGFQLSFDIFLARS